MFHRRALTALTLALAGSAAMAANPISLCVWDPIGQGGQIFDAAKGYALAMSKYGADIKLKAFTDEGVAAEEFKVGQCDGLLATSIRTKVYNPVTAMMDTGGAATITRDGKVDMEASYKVIYKAMQVLASPQAGKFTVQDRWEIAGVMPMGPIYVMVRDKTLFKKGFTGTRMPAFEHDKAQAYLIAKIGAQPVSVDTKTFVSKFNNGATDMVFAPAVAYQPLEIFKGVGKDGGVGRFPLTFASLQLVFERSKLPEGLAAKSRQYWVEQFDDIITTVKKAETGIPANVWVEFQQEEAMKFIANQRDLRVELAQKGMYDKQGLKFMKRVRCSVYAEAPECSNNVELDW
ncbi:MAG: DUF6091 family protein [Aquabacterium sp.]